MADKESKGFKVIDKRNQDSDDSPKKEPEKTDEKINKSAKKDSSPPRQSKIIEDDDKSKSPEQQLPAIDFITFISSLATGALISLGEVEFEDGTKPPKDMISARNHINILDMLIEKTKNNLTEEEDMFLKRVVADLKLRYVQCCENSRR